MCLGSRIFGAQQTNTHTHTPPAFLHRSQGCIQGWGLCHTKGTHASQHLPQACSSGWELILGFPSFYALLIEKACSMCNQGALESWQMSPARPCSGVSRTMVPSPTGSNLAHGKWNQCASQSPCQWVMSSGASPCESAALLQNQMKPYTPKLHRSCRATDSKLWACCLLPLPVSLDLSI